VIRRKKREERGAPRGHRHPADASRRAEGRALPGHPLLRRPVLRPRRHVLQVAEGGAGRRRRGPAGQCAALRHLEPPAPPAAQHDRERAVDRHKPFGSRGGEGVAL